MSIAHYHLDSTLGLPGMTASGAGSAAQLVGFTSSVGLRVHATAAPETLMLGITAPPLTESPPIVKPLRAAAYPVLAGIWDNDDDSLYDGV